MPLHKKSSTKIATSVNCTYLFIETDYCFHTVYKNYEQSDSSILINESLTLEAHLIITYLKFNFNILVRNNQIEVED